MMTPVFKFGSFVKKVKKRDCCLNKGRMEFLMIE